MVFHSRNFTLLIFAVMIKKIKKLNYRELKSNSNYSYTKIVNIKLDVTRIRKFKDYSIVSFYKKFSLYSSLREMISTSDEKFFILKK